LNLPDIFNALMCLFCSVFSLPFGANRSNKRQ